MNREIASWARHGSSATLWLASNKQHDDEYALLSRQ
jgi:hypothetical protein